MKLIETLRRAFGIPDLRRRILFTLWMFVVYRMVAFVPVPGIDKAQIAQLFEETEGTLFSFLDLFAGGTISNFSVIAMGIMPYINASIIMQLLTVVIPKLEEWSKEGPEGRKKMTQWTRYGTVILAGLQAVGFSFLLINIGALADTSFASISRVVITLTAGTIFLMWLGELITDKGIGNGISLLIFAGIVASFPSATGQMINLYTANATGIATIAGFLILTLVVMGLIIVIQEGQRRIPVRYSKRVVGRKMYGGQTTHLPMRVNPAGVIPVIFAAAVLAFPTTIATFINHPWAQAVARALDPLSWVYALTFAIMIIFFTYFYTAIQFNPVDVADNIKKNGGFVPGIRPGRPTSEYLDRVLVRLTLVGAVFLAAVSVMPNILAALADIEYSIATVFGGTALIIVVGVALQTMKQIEAQLMTRQYEGFMR